MRKILQYDKKNNFIKNKKLIINLNKLKTVSDLLLTTINGPYAMDRKV